MNKFLIYQRDSIGIYSQNFELEKPFLEQVERGENSKVSQNIFSSLFVMLFLLLFLKYIYQVNKAYHSLFSIRIEKLHFKLKFMLLPICCYCVAGCG